MDMHCRCYVNYKETLKKISTEIYISNCLFVLLLHEQFEGKNCNELLSNIQLLKTIRKKAVRCSRLLDADITK
jgi:hypothetical protein